MKAAAIAWPAHRKSGESFASFSPESPRFPPLSPLSDDASRCRPQPRLHHDACLRLPQPGAPTMPPTVVYLPEPAVPASSPPAHSASQQPGAPHDACPRRLPIYLACVRSSSNGSSALRYIQRPHPRASLALAASPPLHRHPGSKKPCTDWSDCRLVIWLK